MLVTTKNWLQAQVDVKTNTTGIETVSKQNGIEERYNIKFILVSAGFLYNMIIPEDK